MHTNICIYIHIYMQCSGIEGIYVQIDLGGVDVAVDMPHINVKLKSTWI